MTENPPAPAWTDHNTSDPGITVLEVLAYSYSGVGRNGARFPVAGMRAANAAENVGRQSLSRR